MSLVICPTIYLQFLFTSNPFIQYNNPNVVRPHAFLKEFNHSFQGNDEKPEFINVYSR